MTKRKMLVLSQEGIPHSPIMDIVSGEWDALLTTDTGEARSLINKGNLHIGVVLFSDQHHCVQEKIEEIILSGKSMEWLALLPTACLESPEICNLITGSFYDYHTLPVDPQRLLVTLGHAYGKAQLTKRLDSYGQSSGKYQMVGESLVMQELYQNMRKMQVDDSPVLITGESGTGKELAARAIHFHSGRRQFPFVAVNCGALPTNLIQSELFGHEKGSFTGAFQRKVGRIETAADGTVFLDEIGDLPLELQVNLLRFLQERTIERIGSNRNIPVDARIIAATNVDLESAVKDGRFREDLYYRLNVLRLKIPPLRERGSDIELLARTSLDEFVRQSPCKAKGFSRKAVHALCSHSWPGNVRELLNRVKRAAIMCEGRMITPGDLGLDKPVTTGSPLSLDKAREQAEVEAIVRSLQSNMNNVSKAARQLGVSRVTLYRLINKFQITV